MSDSRRGALHELRVVETGASVACAYCAKLLADLGADVVKVEPPGGDGSRRIAPRTRDGASSALFLYGNTSKRGLLCDPDSEEDRDLLERLIQRADVLVDDGGGRWPAVAGDWESLSSRHPRLVLTRITPYGSSGRRSQLAGDELTLSHASGIANLLPTRSVDIARAPVRMGGNQVAGHGALAAAVATLAALWGRDRRGGGARVDVSLQEVMVAMISPYVTSWRYQGSTWSRVPDRPPAMGRLPTRDGHVILNAIDDHHFAKLRELMGEPEWCAGDQWLSLAYRVNHLMEIADRIEEWTALQGKHELHRAAGSRGIPIGPINDAADVLASEQYRDRGYFVDVDDPRTGRLRYPGWPYRMSDSPPALHRPAPRLGEHDQEIREDLRAQARGEAPARAAAVDACELPLRGVRVLELCWVWAGPYAGFLLGALGADVIRVESHLRSDLMRRAVVWPLPEPRPLRVPPAQGMAFNSVNMSKRSLALDLSTAEGVGIAQRLAAGADVVVDNMRPGALDKLGLGYRDLRRLRPDLVVASSSGRGRGGPESEYLGYAMVHQGIGGGAYITGYPDDAPCHSLGDVDLMNAMTLAASILAALHHRRATGRGQLIDYSQCEGVTSLLGDVLLAYQMTGELPERMANAHPEHAPHNVYPAWGVDRWIAIEVHDDDAFARLCAALGRSELATDPRFSSAAARKRNEAALDTVVAAWTAGRDRDSMVQHLQAARIMAAPSRDGRDLYADRHLRERGAFVEVAHPELGPLHLVGPPFRLEGLRLRATAAPLLGEHSDEILAELGLGAGEIEALRARDVVGPRPVPESGPAFSDDGPRRSAGTTPRSDNASRTG